jgi:hypothetical protein
MSMLHPKSPEEYGHIGFLTETHPGTIAVCLDAEDLAGLAEVHDLILLCEFGLDLDCSIGSGLRI